jgi:alkaline phosphatase D
MKGRKVVFMSAFSLRLCRAAIALLAITTPLLCSAEPLSRIAFGSCAAEDEPQPIWDAVVASSPDLWIWAGDNIYGDTHDMDVMRAKYRQLSQQPGYQALLSSDIPILATWDDHDYGVNDGGADYPLRDESQQVFLDFFGIDEDDPRREREGVYHAEIHGEAGQRIQIIMLDTRYHRSPLRAYPREDESEPRVYWPQSDRDATILGETQWAWLERQLLRPAELRLIVSSIQVLSSEHRFEKWMNFPRERRRLLELLQQTRAEGVVLLSGDRHHAELSMMDRPGLYPLYDLTSSGLNKRRPPTADDEERPTEPNRYRVGRIFRGHHFGVVEVDWNQPDPLVSLSIIDQQAERPILTTFPISSLTLDPARPAGLPDPGQNAVLSENIEPQIRIDGNLNDWQANHFIGSDGEHLLIRFPTPAPTTLTRSPSSVHLVIDFDGDETGSDHFLEAGADLEIIFSPPREPGDRGWRPKITGFDPGPKTLISADMALAVGPSHAAEWFELRLSRSKLSQLLPAAATGGEAGLIVYSRDLKTGVLNMLAHDGIMLPDVRATKSTDPSPAVLPSPAEGGLRVVTLNMLWGSQLDTPEPFARVLKALNPDILLLQEWSRERLTEAQIKRWFRDNIDAGSHWQAMVSGAAGSWSGTLVVSRYPMRGRVPRTTPVDAGGWDFPARFAAAIVETPIGDVLAASVHLKASGAINTPEDERRLAEADAVNRILIGMKSVAQPKYVVLGGDFNLLGDPAVVDRTARMLDQDGSLLTRAEAPVLGDEALLYTFGREGLRSRLDYLVYSDHSLDIANAFVLDSRILDTLSLERMGLESEDSGASDHLPVVMDLLPRRDPAP